MGEKDSKAGEKGKGANFDTRRNPFLDRKAVKGSAPELASVIGLGLVLDKVLRAGNAVMLGHTRDGGGARDYNSRRGPAPQRIQHVGGGASSAI